MDRTIFSPSQLKHLALLSDTLNEQLADPLLLTAALRTWTVMLTTVPRFRDLFLQDCIRCSAEKPAGALAFRRCSGDALFASDL